MHSEKNAVYVMRNGNIGCLKRHGSKTVLCVFKTAVTGRSPGD